MPSTSTLLVAVTLLLGAYNAAPSLAAAAGTDVASGSRYVRGSPAKGAQARAAAGTLTLCSRSTRSPAISLSAFMLSVSTRIAYAKQPYDLSWTAAILACDTGTVIYTSHRSTSEGGSSDLSATAALFADDSVTAGPTTVRYYVTASADGVSSRSNAVSVRIIGPDTPKNEDAWTKFFKGLGAPVPDPWAGGFDVSDYAVRSIPSDPYPASEITGDMLFDTWSALPNVQGLSSLTQVSGTLDIDGAGVNDISGLSGLTSVGGDLDLGGYELDSVTGLSSLTTVGGDFDLSLGEGATNVDGLQHLTRVGGGLDIEGDALTDVSALSGLQTVGGNLRLAPGSQTLTKIGGLSSLTSVGGTINASNSTVHDISGLSSLRSVGGLDFALDAITNVDALSHLTSVPGNVDIGQAPKGGLLNVDGFANLQTVGGNLNLRRNLLTSVSSLLRLTSVGGSLNLDENSLTSLTGLQNLTSIGGGLYLSALPELTDISALSNLRSIGGGLSIVGDGALHDISALENLQSIGGTIYIQGSTNRISGGALCDSSNASKFGGYPYETQAELCSAVH